MALIFRTLDALRIFDLPFVLTKGANGTNTLSLLAYQDFRQNRLFGLGSAMAILTFIIVMIVSFIYIRFVGGNIEALTDRGSLAMSTADATQSRQRRRAEGPDQDRARSRARASTRWMWLAVVAIMRLLPVPVLLARQHRR